MRNIHVLKTDKPSRLYLSDYTTGQHIYITSDEEIKEGCLDLIKYKNHTLGWYLMIKNNSTVLIKYDGSGLYFNTETTKIFKIILTTDGDLIKDGIQAIDDEFLEWFIKNPSCEEVDIKKIYLSNDGQWKEVLLPSEWEVNTKVKLLIIPKEETLEDVAKRYIEEYDVEHYISIEDFIMGAKWQQEQDKNKFSEEDMLLAFQTGRNFQLTGENNFKELIEQLKK